MTDDELKQLIASNAKAIEALSSSLTQERQERRNAYQEWERDRNHLYQYLGRLASAQAGFYEIQADYYRHLEEFQNRQLQMQTDMNDYFRRLEDRQVEMQSQVIEILGRLTPKDSNGE